MNGGKINTPTPQLPEAPKATDIPAAADPSSDTQNQQNTKDRPEGSPAPDAPAPKRRRTRARKPAAAPAAQTPPAEEKPAQAEAVPKDKTGEEKTQEKPAAPEAANAAEPKAEAALTQAAAPAADAAPATPKPAAKRRGGKSRKKAAAKLSQQQAGDTPKPEAPPAKTADTEAPKPQTPKTKVAETVEPEEPVRILTPEEQEAEQRRAAEITRTVQVSIEQIVARMDAQAEPAPEAAELPAAPVPLAVRVRNRAMDMGVGFLKWLLLVVFLVVLIAGAGIYWLYQGATYDMLPRIEVNIDGQQLSPSAYEWRVPVVGDIIARTYRETFSATPTELETTLESAVPTLTISPANEFDSKLKITDAANQTVFEGTVQEFSHFSFGENGDYVAELVLGIDSSGDLGAAVVHGSQTYQFAFEVNMRPNVRLNTRSTTQGSVVSVRVTGLPEGDVPVLQCTLESPGFIEATNGWVAYIPIPYDAPAGSYDIYVRTNSYQEQTTLTVRPRNWEYRDYYSQSRLSSPHIGADELPAEVQAALSVVDPQVHWMASSFVQPFIRSIDITMPFGATEYVGRSVSQRSNNTGTGRTSVNVLVAGRNKEALIAPSDGRIVLAEDLGGTAGNTVIIEHGAGVKSVFYNLRSISVQEGDSVVQGTELGTTNAAILAAVYVGNVPVEPFAVWRGQCDALKYF